MTQFWSSIVHELTPYVPGEQPRIDKLIKLNTNENPYPPSRNALAAIRDSADESLRLYPDPDATSLKSAIARHYKIQTNQVFVGNGSDEVLAHVFMGLLKHEKPLLFPDITYSFYPTYCRLYQIDWRTVPLNDRFEINLDDYDDRGGAIIFPNPNAPTGRLLPVLAIEQLLQRLPNRLVVVDEAYIDFGGTSAIPLTRDHDNLLVIQTLSKSRSLAGLRVGYAVGHPNLITALERVKNSFNSYPLGRSAIAAATAAIEDDNWLQETRRRVMDTRHHLSRALTERGFEVLPSAGNFVFARHPQHDAAKLAQSLREHAILVRHFNQPRIEQFLRITVGTDDQCEALLNALDAIFSAQ